MSRNPYRLWNLPFMPVIPYPLRAAKISIAINPFGFWWKPYFYRFYTNENSKREGDTQWHARWAWFEISYARWL